MNLCMNLGRSFIRTFKATLLSSAILLGFVSSTAAASTQVTMNDLAAGYVSIQEALAQDNYDNAQKHAKSLQTRLTRFEGAEKAALQSTLQELLKAKDLKSTRTAFKKLSPTLVDWVKTTKPQGIIVVYCPMAGASWVQKDGKVQNPYFGTEMLQCGEKKS